MTEKTSQIPGPPGGEGPGARQWVTIIFRGVGQIIFQDHALTGLLFLAGIAVASPEMALGGFIGSAIGTITAVVLKLDRKEIRNGIYGYNSSLVGIALLFFFQITAVSVVLLLLGCIGGAVLTLVLRRWCRFPTYTTAFILVTWLMVAIAHQVHVPGVPSSPLVYHPTRFFAAVLEGLAEVMFQANVYTGLMFLIAIAVSNWRHAVLALLGAVVGSLVGLYHNDPAGQISIGIYGYNASLTAIAVYLWRKSLLLPVLGAIFSTVITEFFPLVGVPALTAPFVLASWVVLAIGFLEPSFFGEKHINIT